MPASHAKSPSQTGAEIFYGPGYAFSIPAPPAWTLDDRSGASQGLQCVLYPRGGSWEKSGAVMYANIAFKDKAAATLPAIIRDDLATLRAQSPRMQVIPAPPLTTASHQPAVVRYLSATPGGNWEAVAYVDEKHCVAELVLSARTHPQFQAALPAFRRLVGGYVFLTGNVRFQKHLLKK